MGFFQDTGNWFKRQKLNHQMANAPQQQAGPQGQDQQFSMLLENTDEAPKNDVRNWNEEVPYEQPYFPTAAELSMQYNKGSQFQSQDWSRVNNSVFNPRTDTQNLFNSSLMGMYMQGQGRNIV